MASAAVLPEKEREKKQKTLHSWYDPDELLIYFTYVMLSVVR